jgi:hypothetical protein
MGNYASSEHSVTGLHTAATGGSTNQPHGQPHFGPIQHLRRRAGWSPRLIAECAQPDSCIQERLQRAPERRAWGNTDEMSITYGWREDFDNFEINRLHAEAFETSDSRDWRHALAEQSLGWATAGTVVNLSGS